MTKSNHLSSQVYAKDTALWVRMAYMEGFRNKTVTAVVRSDDRSDPSHFGFLPTNVNIPVRFIRKIGDRIPGVIGDLLPDEGINVIRTDCIVKCIRDLTSEDLKGCSIDYSTPELVRYHLALTYNQPLPSLDTIITIWQFKYK